MSVYRRGKIYWIDFELKGTRIQRSTHQKIKRVAIQLEGECRAAIGAGKPWPPPDPSRSPGAAPLREYSRKFLDSVRSRAKHKQTTVMFYEEQMRRLLSYEPLASCPLNKIDEARIEGFVRFRGESASQRTKRKVSGATVNRALATLRKLLRLAYEWRDIERVPKIRLLQESAGRDFVLSHQDEKRYLDFAPQPLADLAAVILDTALRTGEALSLQWPDVHLEPADGAACGYIYVRQGKSRAARRNVPLTSRALEILSRRKQHARSLFVFSDGEGKPLRVDSLSHAHARYRRNLKLPRGCVLHSFRHTALTRMGMSGADAFSIKQIAGHSSITISARYVHPTPEALEQAIGRLNGFNKRQSGSRKAESPYDPPYSAAVGTS